MKSLNYLFQIALFINLGCSLAVFASEGTGTRGGGDIACQHRIELIRNNLEERVKDGSLDALDFTGTGTTAQTYAQTILKIMDFTRDRQSSISCTTHPKDVSEVVGGAWTPICAAEWLDDKNVNPKDRKLPKILCYTGVEKDGVYTGGLMGMSGNEQYGQIDHELNVLGSFEDQQGEYSHYLISSRISEKSQATTYWLWPAANASGGTQVISTELLNDLLNSKPCSHELFQGWVDDIECRYGQNLWMFHPAPPHWKGTYNRDEDHWTVTDKASGLTVTHDAVGGAATLKDAEKLCQEVELNGHYRLPAADEMTTLIKDGYLVVSIAEISGSGIFSFGKWDAIWTSTSPPDSPNEFLFLGFGADFQRYAPGLAGVICVQKR